MERGNQKIYRSNWSIEDCQKHDEIIYWWNINSFNGKDEVFNKKS